MGEHSPEFDGVMEYLRSLRLDAILVTGDIADHGRYDEYEQAKASLTADVPVLTLPEIMTIVPCTGR